MDRNKSAKMIMQQRHNFDAAKTRFLAKPRTDSFTEGNTEHLATVTSITKNAGLKAPGDNS